MAIGNWKLKQGVSATSREAFREIQQDGLPVRQRERVYELLSRSASPLTSLDLAKISRLRHTSVLARINSLCESGCVCRDKPRLNPESGKLNDTYVVCGPYTAAVKRLSEKEELRQRIETLENHNMFLLEKIKHIQGPRESQGNLFK